MNNIFFKNTVLILSLGLLSNTSISANNAYDNDLSNSTKSMTAKHINSQYTDGQIKELREMVFSGEPLLKIGSYLGRQETGRLQQVSKSVNHFFTQQKEALRLWKGYAQQLQLKIIDNIKVKDLISQIKNYYTSDIKLVKLKKNFFDGDIEPLVVVNYRFNSLPQIFSTNNSINVEEAKKNVNKIRKKAAIWNWLGMVSLNDYPFEQPHDYLSTLIAVSSDSSDFIAQSDTGKTYKAHIPRYDLWKMR